MPILVGFSSPALRHSWLRPRGLNTFVHLNAHRACPSWGCRLRAAAASAPTSLSSRSTAPAAPPAWRWSWRSRTPAGPPASSRQRAAGGRRLCGSSATASGRGTTLAPSTRRTRRRCSGRWRCVTISVWRAQRGVPTGAQVCAHTCIRHMSHALPVRLRLTAMRLPCNCHATAMRLSCDCNATAMRLLCNPRLSRDCASRLRAATQLPRDCATRLPHLCPGACPL